MVARVVALVAALVVALVVALLVALSAAAEHYKVGYYLSVSKHFETRGNLALPGE